MHVHCNNQPATATCIIIVHAITIQLVSLHAPALLISTLGRELYTSLNFSNKQASIKKYHFLSIKFWNRIHKF